MALSKLAAICRDNFGVNSIFVLIILEFESNFSLENYLSGYKQLNANETTDTTVIEKFYSVFPAMDEFLTRTLLD